MLCWEICCSIAVSLAKNVLTPLATLASGSATDSTIQRKMYGGGIVRTGKRITFDISNEDMDNIRIIKLLENSS